MNIFNRTVLKFISKSGKEILVYEPSMDRLRELLVFINRLVAEDTYLNLTGRPKTLSEEKRWLEGTISEIKTGKSIYYWAVCEGKIVGSVGITHGFERSWHVGKIGLMVDKDYRRDGIGQKLLELILRAAKKFDLKIAILDVFDENLPAIKLYEKIGFKKFGKLPAGLFRKGHYSDAIEMFKVIE